MYASFYVLLTIGIKKTLYILIGVETYQDATLINIVFNQVYAIVIFCLFLLLTYKAYQKNNSTTTFNGLLILTFLYTIIIYYFSWCVDVFFYYVHEFINPQPKNMKEGLLAIADHFMNPYAISSLGAFSYFITYPIDAFIMFLKTGDYTWIIGYVKPPSFLIASFVIYFKSLFELFKNEKQTKWYALIPVFNDITLLRITQKPLWWILPMHVPFIRFIPKFYVNQNLSIQYGKSKNYAIGMTLLPWYFYGKILLGNKK